MRMIMTLVVCLVTMLPLAAQKKLRYEIDKVSGDTSFHTSEERLYVKAGSSKSMGEILKSTVYKSGAGFRLAFFIQTGRTSVFNLEANSTAEIRLMDGNAVTIVNYADHNSRPTAVAYGSMAYGFYRLKPGDIEKLKTSPVILIRIRSSVGNMDYEIKEKFSEVLADQLGKF